MAGSSIRGTSDLSWLTLGPRAYLRPSRYIFDLLAGIFMKTLVDRVASDTWIARRTIKETNLINHLRPVLLPQHRLGCCFDYRISIDSQTSQRDISLICTRQRRCLRIVHRVVFKVTAKNTLSSWLVSLYRVLCIDHSKSSEKSVETNLYKPLPSYPF